MTTTSETQFETESTPTDIHEYLTQLIKKATSEYLVREQLATPLETLPVNLQFSAQNTFGDYSMPVMAWASKDKLKRPPLQIAEALATILREGNYAGVQEITVTKPGYLNFRVQRAELGKSIMERVHEAGADFGQSEIGRGTKVVVEHTNINSNKAAHVGHLRNSCLGDTVVRMLRSQGYQVEADNYIDDTGVQVADVVIGLTMLNEGLLELPGGNEQHPDESFDYFCSRVYVAVGKAYEDDPELLKRRTDVLHAIEAGITAGESNGEANYAKFASDLSQKIVKAHLATMARLNITYDLLTWESAVLGADLWKRTFAMLQQKGVLDKPETGKAAGCWIVRLGENDEQNEEEGEHFQDKILVRSNGTATYTAKDIAYQLWKFGLADDPAIGVQFHFIPWGRQRDGRTLWSMRPPLAEIESQETDPTRFGHASRVINVIDVRQSYLQQVVYESLRRLGFTAQAANSLHLSYEVVTLSSATAARLGVDTSDGRDFYPMSGRKGIEIKADDLINIAIARLQESRPELSSEIAENLASSAIRYFMIRFGLNQIISLDVDEALRPNGDTGVYIQYAYARANSILRKLQDAAYEIPETLETLPDTLEQSEWELLRQIDAYPRTLAEASERLGITSFANYVYDLANHFSDFYEHTPPIVRESDERIKAFRALLVRTTVQTMDNALRVLGFVPQERI